MKTYNPYGDCHIMHMNMMGIKIKRKRKIAKSVLFASFLPVLSIGLFMLTNYLPELNFVASCINVSGGDICSIAFG